MSIGSSQFRYFLQVLFWPGLLCGRMSTAEAYSWHSSPRTRLQSSLSSPPSRPSSKQAKKSKSPSEQIFLWDLPSRYTQEIRKAGGPCVCGRGHQPADRAAWFGKLLEPRAHSTGHSHRSIDANTEHPVSRGILCVCDFKKLVKNLGFSKNHELPTAKHSVPMDFFSLSIELFPLNIMTRVLSSVSNLSINSNHLSCPYSLMSSFSSRHPQMMTSSERLTCFSKAPQLVEKSSFKYKLFPTRQSPGLPGPQVVMRLQARGKIQLTPMLCVRCDKAVPGKDIASFIDLSHLKPLAIQMDPFKNGKTY